MKKKKFFLIFIILYLLFIPSKMLAKEYECYYENENGAASAGYDTKNKKVYLIKWGSKDINKYVSINRSKNDYKPDKCYKYICIYRKKRRNSNYTKYDYAFYLGDKQEDFSSSTDCNIWTLKGAEQSESEKIKKKCDVKLTPTIINLNKINFDIEDKPGVSDVNFTFYSYEDNTRSFCVYFDGKTNCSNRFLGNETATVKSNIKNKNGDILSFTIEGESADKYFTTCVDSKKFELNENGNTFSLGVKKSSTSNDTYDEGEEVYGCEVVPEEVRKWISISLNFVKYAALILVIVLGTIDFIKAAASGEPDSMKKAGQSFIKRVVAVIILFLLPMLVELILNLIDLYGANTDCF